MGAILPKARIIMTTQTERLRQALVADGWVRNHETRSAREGYTKSVRTKSGQYVPYYVWLLTGTLRGSRSPRYGDAQALPTLVTRLLTPPPVSDKLAELKALGTLKQS